VVYSDCKERGIYAIRDYVISQPWAKHLRTELMEGNTPSEERERMRERFNDGKTDVLFLSPVGSSSLNLLNCAGIIFVEVPQSQGAQEQAAARILRSGAEQKRPDMVVEIHRFISRFSRRAPNAAQLKELWDALIEYSRFNKAVLINEWEVDIWPHLQEQLDQVGWETADEHRASNNLDKNEKLQPMLAAIRAATIDLNGHSKKYVDQFEEILASAAAA
jgi:superfamily II DNA or RNA helicase